MIELNLVQGSPEWLAHRAKYRNASDTPSVTGSSTYKSRAEFLKERATGIIPEVDAATQRRFDDGHRFEALARPLMEKIIGEDLFPVVGVDGPYSASFDGLTMMGDTNGEHKTINDAIRACQTAAELPLMYREQMEHQMMVSGAGRSLFFASKWKLNDDGEYVLEEEKHFWCEPDMALRQKICAAWDQFDIDVANYNPVEVIPAATAAPTLDLPVVSIQTSGAIAIRSNLRAFGEALNSFIERLPTKPSTDQEFADCKAALTKLKTAEETLDSEESRALSQMTEIDEMRREKKLYQDLARTTRLALEKLVTARESAIKVEIVAGGKAALAEHIVGLNTRLGKPYMPVVAENFATVIKNKRTITSLRDAVDTELARCKIAANEIADKIQINLNSMRELAAEHAFLFADTASIVLKANDDLVVLVKSRIYEHKAEEERKTEKIRQDERDKIAAKEVADKAEAARKAAEAAATPVVAVVPEQTQAAQPVEAAMMQASAPACDSYRPVIQPNAAMVEPIFAHPGAPSTIDQTPKQDTAWKIAVDLKIDIKVTNDVLSFFSPELKSSLYKRNEAEQSDLPLDPGHLPTLKFPAMAPIKWDWSGAGYDAIVNWGVSGKDDITMIQTEIDTFKFDCQDGGTVAIGFRIIAHPTPDEIGRLSELVQREITLTLTPPSPEDQLKSELKAMGGEDEE